MEDSNVHSFYQYRLCLYDYQDSSQNCTSGNFTSLPLTSRNILWNIVFGEQSSNDTNSTPTANTDDSSNPPVAPVLAVTITCVVVVVVATILQCLRRYLRYLRRVFKEPVITIPTVDGEMDNFNVEEENNRLKKTRPESIQSRPDANCLYKDDVKRQNTIISGKYPFAFDGIAPVNVSFENESAAELKGYSSDDHHINTSICIKNFCKKLEKVIHCVKPEAASEKTQKGKYARRAKCKDETVLPKKMTQENKDKKHEERGFNIPLCRQSETPLLDIFKKEVSHVWSPGETENQSECIDVDPADSGISLQTSSSVDYTRYNWDKIFTYLAEKVVVDYFRFFNELLAGTGCTDVHNKISTIEADMRGYTTFRKIRALFCYWQQGVGSSINLKHIEDAFESLGWNMQLEQFRQFMRNPPMLDESKQWNEPCGGQPGLPMIPGGLCSNNVTFQAFKSITIQQNGKGQNKRRCRKYIHNKYNNKRYKRANIKPHRQHTLFTHLNDPEIPASSVSANMILTPSSESGYGSSNPCMSSPANSGMAERTLVFDNSEPGQCPSLSSVFVSNADCLDSIEPSSGESEHNASSESEHSTSSKSEHSASLLSGSGHSVSLSGDSKHSTSSKSKHSASSKSDHSVSLLSESGHTTLLSSESEHSASSKSEHSALSKSEHSILLLSESGHSVAFESENEHSTLLSSESEDSASSETEHSASKCTCLCPGVTNEIQRSKDQDNRAKESSELPNDIERNARSSGWNMSSSRDATPQSNLSFVESGGNRKRQIRNTSNYDAEKRNPCKRKKTDDGNSRNVRNSHKRHSDNSCDDQYVKKTKIAGNADRKFINPERKVKKLTAQLVQVIEDMFETKKPVDKDSYSIFINDLMSRLTERPHKYDIISLDMNSFYTADTFKTKRGENIRVMNSRKLLLPLREREWTSLRTYVEHARPVLLERAQLNTDVLFLSYNGEPLVQCSI